MDKKSVLERVEVLIVVVWYKVGRRLEEAVSLKDKADEGGTKTKTSLEISNILCRRYMEMRGEERRLGFERGF